MLVLHRSLEGEAPPPVEWIVSRVCEEFGCLPSRAVREIETGDWGLLWDVMDLRAYARTYQRVRDGRERGDLEVDDMTMLVQEIDAQVQRERLERMRSGM